MKLSGLSRQIGLSMMLIALGVALLTSFSSYLFFYLWQTYWPQHFPEELGFLPAGPEWIWILGTLLAGVVAAVLVAVKLSRRILTPLHAVADGIRRVAQGDLAARADAGPTAPAEAAQLVADFNQLAGKLQQMSQEQQFWNAAIAHELRTPVTILRGRLQGLADGVFVADDSQFQSLLHQVENLTRLIEDLRVVSLAESGHLKLQQNLHDLNQDIRTVVSLLQPALQAAGMQTELALVQQLVSCDAVRIRQALLALLDNCIKHAAPGMIRISTEVQQGWFTLAVEDQGPGLAADFMPHVFTAFRRAADAGPGGSGLGLAVVAAITSAHGGTASCCASAAGGVRFELRWPLSL